MENEYEIIFGIIKTNLNDIIILKKRSREEIVKLWDSRPVILLRTYIRF